MDWNIILTTVILCLLPISELRGALPFALSNRMELVPAFFLCVTINALIGPLAYLFLASAHKLLLKWNIYKKLFEKFILRARQKLEKKTEKYGYAGLAIFVGIPLPLTGAWTGAMGAWILGMKPVKSILAISAGVFISAVIVASVYFLIIYLGDENSLLKDFLKIFIKT